MARKPKAPNIPNLPGVKTVPGRVPGRPGIKLSDVRASVLKTVVTDLKTFKTAVVNEAGEAFYRNVTLAKKTKSETLAADINKDIMNRAFGMPRPMAPSEDEAPTVVEIRVKGGLPSEQERINMRNAAGVVDEAPPELPKEPDK